MNYSKDALFAFMITKKPVTLVDWITGKTHTGVIKSIQPEPGHEINAIIKVGRKMVYFKTED